MKNIHVGVKIPVFQRVDIDTKDASSLVGLSRGGQVCLHVCVYACVRACICRTNPLPFVFLLSLYVCTCVCERERERDRTCVCACECMCEHACICCANPRPCTCVYSSLYVCVFVFGVCLCIRRCNDYHRDCIRRRSARPYESCKISKGRPRRNAFSKLVHRQYKSFPPDRFCQVEMKNSTR